MRDSKEKTLDDVIQACEEIYELEVTEENRDKYVRFLERQLAAHSDYDLNKTSFRDDGKYATYPYCRLLTDKLLLFSYLIGETIIIAGRTGNTEEKRIETVDDLYMLRPTEFGAGRYRINQTDKNLTSLYSSFQHYNRIYLKLSFPNWSMAIDELGRDEEVVRHLGMEINTKMIRNCHSPYKNDLKQ